MAHNPIWLQAMPNERESRKKLTNKTNFETKKKRELKKHFTNLDLCEIFYFICIYKHCKHL